MGSAVDPPCRVEGDVAPKSKQFVHKRGVHPSAPPRFRVSDIQCIADQPICPDDDTLQTEAHEHQLPTSCRICGSVRPRFPSILDSGAPKQVLSVSIFDLAKVALVGAVASVGVLQMIAVRIGSL